jgi:hypothetical protein
MSKTKRIDNQDLPSSSFLWVGDVENISTWNLPVYFAGNREKTLNHIKNAAHRFSEMKRIPESELPAVWLLLQGAAIGNGIHLDPAMPERAKTAEQIAAEAAKLREEELAEKSAAAVADLAEERRQQIMQADIEEVESELWRQRAKEQLAELTA